MYRYAGRPANVCPEQSLATGSSSALQLPKVIDEYTRECLAIPVGGSIRSGRVIAPLSKLIRVRR
jgi:hypothetical protein